MPEALDVVPGMQVEMRVPVREGEPVIRTLASALACLVVLVGGASWTAADDTDKERLIRGALLYKFAKFVEWPQELGAEGEPLELCIFQDRSFAELIESKVNGITVKGRPIAVRALENATDARSCHIVYYAKPDELAAALSALQGVAVLTVSSHDGFLELGGMINLVRNEDSLGFEINLTASRKAGLELSARLLEAAARVENNP